MLDDLRLIDKLTTEYGCPLYVFNEQGFVDNFNHLLNTFKSIYENYCIAYSFKTNYTPYIASTVKRLGGYAEVVSGMEYHIAKKIGYEDQKIIFNGPNKGVDGELAFLNGSLVNVDNYEEAKRYCEIAKINPTQKFKMGIRVNLDLGQNFVSRFGIDVEEIGNVFELVQCVGNVEIVGLHCHISRCRGIEAWIKRTEIMLALSDKYFKNPPMFLDLGSGMYGSMDPQFAAQFNDVPTYEEYATAVAGMIADHYKDAEYKPILFTEPGTTLINRFVDFIGKVDVIKSVRGKSIAVLNCSTHNLGETCILKELPLKVVAMGEQKEYADIDITGYTCLEQDVIRKNYHGHLAVGNYIVFGNVGGYSNVLKPPFIWPNCKMVANCSDGKTKIIKNAETYEDVLHTYVF